MADVHTDGNPDGDYRTFLNDLHKWCGSCGGSGVTHDKYGGITDCPDIDLHAYIERLVPQTEKLESLQKKSAMDGRIICDLSKQVDTYAAHLDAVHRIANQRPLDEYQGRYDPLTAATAVLNEIRAEVNSRDQQATLSRMRAEALSDAAYRLHVDLGAGTCVCGETWQGDERGCAERRRMLNLADKMRDGEDADMA